MDRAVEPVLTRYHSGCVHSRSYSLLRDLHRIRTIRLDLSDGDPVTVILDDQRIDSRHEETGTVHAHGEGFVVAPSMLHDDPGFAVQGMQLVCQQRNAFGCVLYLEWFHDHFASLTQHGHGASAVGNIDSYCEHIASSRYVTTMAYRLYPSPILSVR